jgi:hypothetical protein
VDSVHGLPEEERPEGHREVGRHPHHLLPLLRSLWLRPLLLLSLSAADLGILRWPRRLLDTKVPPVDGPGSLSASEELSGLGLHFLLGLNFFATEH